MKPVHLVLTITFAITALGLTAWLGKEQGRIPVIDPKPVAAKTDDSELPIPTAGPFGKAAPVETTFNFGAVEKGDKGSHAFVIKNDGQGPLRLKTGKTSCGQCTFAETGENEIPPGGSAEVKINWEIKLASGKFRQTAEVHTTDPDNRKLTLAIEGLVDTPIHLVPEGLWILGDLSESEATTAEGLLFSTRFDGITMVNAECSNPLVKVTWEPSDSAVLAEKQAKWGMKIKVLIPPGPTVGPVRETIKLHTGGAHESVIEFDVTGKRPGAIEMKGRGWNAENNVVMLGEFPANQGIKSKLTMYVRGLEEELTAEHVPSENGRVQVRVASTGKKFGKSKVYEVEIEIPPGAAEFRRSKGAEPIVLKLNHPTITEFKMYADYHAR